MHMNRLLIRLLGALFAPLYAVTHGAGTRTVIADAVVDRIDVGGTGTLVFRTSGDVEVATLTFSATGYGAAVGPTATANAITADSNATGGTIAKAAQGGVANGVVILCSVPAPGGGGHIELNSVVVSAGQQDI